MRIKVMSKMFAGGYNSIYEQAWNDSLECFIDYYNDEYDIKILNDEIVNIQILIMKKFFLPISLQNQSTAVIIIPLATI